MTIAERYQKLTELQEESMGLLGMVAEVNAKANLLRNQLDEMDDTPERKEYASIRLMKMRDDLARYSQRLVEIDREADEYLEMENGQIC